MTAAGRTAAMSVDSEGSNSIQRQSSSLTYYTFLAQTILSIGRVHGLCQFLQQITTMEIIQTFSLSRNSLDSMGSFRSFSRLL